MAAKALEFEPNLSFDDACLIDRLCDAFEKQWGSGVRPCVEECAPGVTAELRRHLIRELIPIDSFYRLQQGDRPQASDYAERFPQIDCPSLESMILAAGNEGDWDAPARPTGSVILPGHVNMRLIDSPPR